VVDEAEQKGTGRWTVQSALELGVPVTGIAEAVFARSLSGHGAQRAAARILPGPPGGVGEVRHQSGDAGTMGAGGMGAATGGMSAGGTATGGAVPAGPGLSPAEAERFTEDVRRALYASKVVAYAQGFDQITAGSAAYGWDVDLGAMATIWRGGCIIRARFLDRVRQAYADQPDLPSLLLDDYFREALTQAQGSWRRVVATAATLGIPAPGFASALAYYDALRRDRLPAALVQGLRDLFGAHTYRRIDKDGAFHTLWAGDRTEVAG
jgi:6-phosphogluconate dehydrogenase